MVTDFIVLNINTYEEIGDCRIRYQWCRGETCEIQYHIELDLFIIIKVACS